MGSIGSTRRSARSRTARFALLVTALWAFVAVGLPTAAAADPPSFPRVCSGMTISGSIPIGAFGYEYALYVPHGMRVRVTGPVTNGQSAFGGWDAVFSISTLDPPSGGGIGGQNYLVGNYYAGGPVTTNVTMLSGTNSGATRDMRLRVNQAEGPFGGYPWNIISYSFQVTIEDPGTGGVQPCQLPPNPNGVNGLSEYAGLFAGGFFLSDPVSATNGNFANAYTDLEFPSQVFFGWARAYNSMATNQSGVLGRGWTTMVDATASLDANTGVVTIHAPDGKNIAFISNQQGGWWRSNSQHAVLTQPSGLYRVVFDSGERWDFDSAGRLASRTDTTTGQTIVITRDGNGRATSAASSAGRTLTFSYNGSGNLSTVTSSDGRSLSYGYDANGLSTVTLPAGGVEHYTTNANGLITQITDPTGVLVASNTFDAQGRVTAQTVAGPSTLSFSYDDANRKTTITDSASGDVTVVAYDQFLHVSGLTDPDAKTATPTYNAFGDLTRLVDRLGKITTQSFDANSNLLSRSTPDGATATFTYDTANRVLTSTDGTNRTTTYTYTGASTIPATITDPAGKVTTLTSSAGLITSVVDADGVTTTLGYDSARNLTSVTDGNSNTTTFTYDGAGRPLTLTTAEGRTTTWTYDGEGRVLTETDPAGKTTTNTYNSAGRLLTVTDPQTAVTTYTYDTAGRVATITDPNGNVTTKGYNANGDLTSVTAPGGAVTTYTYGKLGRLLSSTDPTGVVATFGYDAAGNQTTITDTTGKTWTTTYDTMGRPLSKKDPNNHTTAWTYDGAGRILTETDPNSKTTTYAYDTAGRLQTETNALNAVTTYTYTPAGRLLTVKDANQLTTTFGYDAAGQQTTITNPLNGISTTTFNKDRQPLTRTTPGGLMTTWTYDIAGRVATVTEPGKGTTTNTYTNRGELATSTNQLGGVTAYVYDLVGNLASVTDPNNHTTTYTYDGRGNRLTQTSAQNTTTTWTWDLADRQLTETDPLNHTTTHTYDTNGRLATITDPTAKVETRTYDPAGQLTKRAWPGLDVTFTYDNAGRRATMTDPTGVSTYVRDAVGQLVDLTHVPGDDVLAAATQTNALVPTIWTTNMKWAYDPGGRVTAFTYPFSPVATTADGANSNGDTFSTTITLPDGSKKSVNASIQMTVNYTYDGGGRVTKANSPFGDNQYTYDADGRVLSENVSNQITRSYQWTAGLLTSFTQTRPNRPATTTTVAYDAVGRQISETTGAVTTAYGYDAASQLVSATLKQGTVTVGGQTWAYDATGARTTETTLGAASTVYTTNAADQLVTTVSALSTNSFSYDAAGRQTHSETATRQTDTTYDVRGLPTRLTTSDRTSGSSTNVTDQVRAYDGDGRLVAISTGTGSTVHRNSIVWDVNRRVAQPVMITTDNVPTQLIYGSTNRAQSATLGSVSAFSHDAHGSTIIDPGAADTAAFAAAPAYSPWGAPATPTDSSAPRFGYRGELQIGAQLHLRARDYAPRLGVFTTTDPLGGVAGTATIANPYHYADNNPLNTIDPLGLRPEDHGWDLFLEQFGFDSWADLLPHPQGGLAHGLLDAAGMLPFVGEVFDLANGALYLLEGDWTNAGISAAALIPILGSGGTGARRLAPEATRLVPGGGLAAHEAAGGHALARHLDMTDSDLLARLASQPNISGASTFANRAAAESSIAGLLDANAAGVQSWLQSGGSQLVLRGQGAGITGRYVAQGSSSVLDVSGLQVVLRADPSLGLGYRIHTAYPVPSP